MIPSQTYQKERREADERLRLIDACLRSRCRCALASRICLQNFANDYLPAAHASTFDQGSSRTRNSRCGFADCRWNLHQPARCPPRQKRDLQSPPCETKLCLTRKSLRSVALIPTQLKLVEPKIALVGIKVPSEAMTVDILIALCRSAIPRD